MRTISGIILTFACAASLTLSPGCESQHWLTPALPVLIDLGDAGLWNTYGVAGMGDFKYFNPSLGLPAGFRYSGATVTGYGGVLLIGGMDPFTTDTNVPLAYDRSCPYENSASVRVFIDMDNLTAVCEKCGSCYNVTTGAGAAISGPVLGCEQKRLRPYRCEPTQFGGYIIRNQ